MEKSSLLIFNDAGKALLSHVLERVSARTQPPPWKYAGAILPPMLRRRDHLP